jgi:hypothetical protein
MRSKRPILIAATVASLMSVAAPAYAVTPNECTGQLNGQLEEKGNDLLCVFPADAQECKAKFDGVPRGDVERATECVVKVE